MIGVIDYGMGNLFSVVKCLERLGAKVQVIGTAEEIAEAEKLILPGVGAFGDAMKELNQRDLVLPIQQAVANGKPFLGVCLGLQLLFERSEEGGPAEGLGLLRGHVTRFSRANRSGRNGKLKIPHMGWNQITLRKRDAKLVRGIRDQEYFYFVHSYYAVPEDSGIVAGETEYGIHFASIISSGNLSACQFHPEKSQQAGQKILKNFLDLF